MKRLLIVTLVPLLLGVCPAPLATARPLGSEPLRLAVACRTGGTCTSRNWAGYVGTGHNGTFTLVRGHWIAQPAACPARGRASYSQWVGIDGFDSADLLQTGTAVHCKHGRGQIVAWWEAVPLNAEQDEFTVSSGDQIVALVRYASATGIYHMRLRDKTLGATLHSHGTCPTRSCPNDSAEWIVERPFLCSDPTDPTSCHLDRLADFRTAGFTQSSAGSSTRSAKPIGALVHTRFNVTDTADRVLMSTSRLDATRAGFSVTWRRPS